MTFIKPVLGVGAYTPSTPRRTGIRPTFGAGAYAVSKTTMRKPIALPVSIKGSKATPAKRELPKQAPCRLCGSLRGVRNNGRQPLATYYSGLMDQLKLMKSRSVNLSVVA